MTITNSTFDGNSAMPAGGALHVEANTIVDISLCKFLNNYIVPLEDNPDPVVELGGAVYVAILNSKGSIKFSRCTFKNNTAGYGGALHIVGPSSPGDNVQPPTLERCVFTKNRASVSGGAFVVRNIRKVRCEWAWPFADLQSVLKTTLESFRTKTSCTALLIN